MTPREALHAPVSNRLAVAVIMPLVLPLFLWLCSVAWSTKVDRAEYDKHLTAHAVEAEQLNEVLCTVKPNSRHCH